MTKKKRELIEILLDNVKPEDWPEKAVYAAQDKETLTWGKWVLMFYSDFEIPHVNVRGESFVGEKVGREIKLPELCENWNKTIVHRDEFMKRWNERNQSVDSEGWIQWNGGEMPVEKGTLIDVKYRRGLINLHVKAGEYPSGGSIPERAAIDFKHDDNRGDIIAYRLHAPQQQKTPQQLALEKFGADWHDNEGVQPVDDGILIDVMFNHGGECVEPIDAKSWSFSCEDGLGEKESSFTIMKWRIHSDDKESHADHGVKPLAFDDGPMTSEPVRKPPLSTQIGGDHYTKLAIQPMQYSMKNGLDPLQHTIIKYVTRFRDKAGIEDLEKAKHCIDMLIEFERDKQHSKIQKPA